MFLLKSHSVFKNYFLERNIEFDSEEKRRKLAKQFRFTHRAEFQRIVGMKSKDFFFILKGIVEIENPNTSMDNWDQSY
eukprot:CAMPEP_0170513158 /NCGR_PEP_ID=MMETSP0208-20121228/67246_1 /TAXON_ID=197538 /ORGANISM="Strombidium inclinatum, Strain S3" /LENGTH=77 /DNA_ID=CAMNT_0010796863 /DNA_START=688 /DNA_END=921 /DNA_ORIENTATION=+